MICNNCGAEMQPGTSFCLSCGADMSNNPNASVQIEQNNNAYRYSQPEYNATSGNYSYNPGYQQPYSQPVYQQQPIQPQVISVSSPRIITEYDLPPQYRPLSPWKYFGMSILYSLPIVGFILLIVFSISDDNINLRNFTRSFWCGLIIIAVIVLIVFGISAIFGSAIVYNYGSIHY